MKNGRRVILWIPLFIAWMAGCGPSSSVEEIVMKNGLRIILKHTSSNLTSAVIRVSCGELDGPSSLTRLTNLLVTEGTEIRSREQIHEEIELAGGEIGSETALVTSIFFVRTLPTGFASGFSILCECLSRPTFDEEQVKRISAQIEIKNISPPMFNLVSAGYPLKDLPVRQLLFQGSLLERDIKLEKVSYSRAQIQDHFRIHYRTDRMVLTVVGRFDKKAVLKTVAEAWQGTGDGNPVGRCSISLGNLSEGRRKTVSEKSSVDRVLVGFRAPACLTDDFYPFYLFTKLLAKTKASEMTGWMTLAGKYQWPWSVVYTHEDSYGYLVVFFETPAGAGGETADFFLKQLDEMRTKGVPARSFEFARRKTETELGLIFEKVLREAVFLSQAVCTDASSRTVEQFQDRMSRMTKDDVDAMMKNWLSDPVVWISRGIPPKTK